MNKQQLASAIWDGANKLRGRISANQYKDYMLGFIFYKYLSNYEVNYIKTKYHFSDEDIKGLSEQDERTKKNCQDNLGYFISYDNLFSTWIDLNRNFSIKNVTEGINAFNRLIGKNHKKVFSGIFDTLSTGITDIASGNDSEKTKAVRNLIKLINKIPMDKSQDYDVLGFIYEYLLKNFAANAGKAGEFYTPHEASELMSEIIADHLKDRKKIDIYDPTSGSASLLLNIGTAIAKYIDGKDKVKYYAQELNAATYNLTRMNLVMQNVIPNNIVVRNDDTLADDWPFFEDNNKDAYEFVAVDACVSNPPYSQSWETKDQEKDPRFKNYGLAPKSRADLAFLLHNLYHLKNDGIMTIVLPHGTLYRGEFNKEHPQDSSDESKIRYNLIEHNNIETIIGMPGNMFFGTSIPTIIMVLKKIRSTDDVLFIDASKCFIKEGTKNKLQAKDVRKIVDVVLKRENILGFSRLVTKEEIRENNYNLNIPRYISSLEKPEDWDIYATMYGGIPNREIDEMHKYWETFPSLKEQMFERLDIPFSKIKSMDIQETINSNSDVKQFKTIFSMAFKDFEEYLKSELITNLTTINVYKEKPIIAENIKERLKNIKLIDFYDAYQVFSDAWSTISLDLEIMKIDNITKNDLSCLRKVDEHRVPAKDSEDGDVSEEIVDGYVGHILPFEIVQKELLTDNYNKIAQKQERCEQIDSELKNIIEKLSEEDKQDDYFDEESNTFATKALSKYLENKYKSITSGELGELNKYLKMLECKAKKQEKLAFINESQNVNWRLIDQSKDGTYNKLNTTKYYGVVAEKYEFEDESLDQLLQKANSLINEQKLLKKSIKEENKELNSKTITTLENLSDSEVLNLLHIKWNRPLVDTLEKLPDLMIEQLKEKLSKLNEKYNQTFISIENDMAKIKKQLSQQIDELDGDKFDLDGLKEFKNILGK